MRGDLEAEGRRRPRALYGTFIKVRRCVPGGAVPCDVIVGHTPFRTPRVPTFPVPPALAPSADRRRARSLSPPRGGASPPALIGRPAVASGRREAPCDVMAP